MKKIITKAVRKIIGIKTAAVLTAVSLLLVMLPITGMAAESAGSLFSDLPAAHWAHSEITDLAQKGVINGFPDGTYRPETPVTREQFARLVVGLLEAAPDAAEAIFSDVSVTGWSNVWVTAAVRRGIIIADEYGEELGAGEPISREEAAVWMIRAIGVGLEDGETGFNDNNALTHKAEIKAAVEIGLITGMPGNLFAPAGSATRAQAAVLVTRMSGILAEIAPGEAGSVSGAGSGAASQNTSSFNEVWIVPPELDYDEIYNDFTIIDSTLGEFYLDSKTGVVIGEVEEDVSYTPLLSYMYGYYPEGDLFFWPMSYFELYEDESTIVQTSNGRAISVSEVEKHPADEYNDEYYMMKPDSKWALYANGKFVSDFIYENIIGGNSGAFVKSGGKFAVSDLEGNVLTDFVYDDVSILFYGFAAVKKGSKWGFIDGAGNELLPFKYEHAVVIDENTAFVKYNGLYGILDVKKTASTEKVVESASTGEIVEPESTEEIVEPDSIESMPFSIAVSGIITTAEPTERHTIVLLIPGTIELSLTTDGSSGALPNQGADIAWFNAAGSRLGGSSGGVSLPYSETRILQAGVYFIDVIGRGGVGQTGTYNIRADYINQDTEPNNTLETAQFVVPGLTVRASITEQDRIDIYRYELTQPGRLHINTSRNTETGGIYEGRVRLLDADGEVIQNGDLGSIFAGFREVNLTADLEAGIYFVEIIPRNYLGSNDSGIYELIGIFTAAKNNAVKPNNTLETAQTITFEQTVRGFISHQEKIDVFRIELTKPGRFTINTNRDTYDIGIPEAVIRLLDADGELIQRGDLGPMFHGFRENNLTTDLEAGIYFIEIIPRNYVGSNDSGTYNLSTTFTAAENNTIKPNSTRATAQLLRSGQTIRGFISHQERTDIFRIDLTQPGKLTVNTNRDNTDDIGIGRGNVRLLDTDGAVIQSGEIASVWNGFQENSLTADLGAGIYFIEITPMSGSNFSTGTYNLSVVIS